MDPYELQESAFKDLTLEEQTNFIQGNYSRHLIINNQKQKDFKMTPLEILDALLSDFYITTNSIGESIWELGGTKQQFTSEEVINFLNTENE